MADVMPNVAFFLAVLVISVSGQAAYDESLSAKYIWLAQATGADEASIRNWSCGLACSNLTEIHEPMITQRGFPLQTLAVVAKYGLKDCVVAFRGSKTLLNYLLDDFNFVWTQPYRSCPKCKVHDGFYKSWRSVAGQTFSALTALGCDDKPIRLVGHSLGAAMAALAAFDMAANLTIKHVYTYGQPRLGNTDWVEAFENVTHNIPYFRVVDYMDAVPHLPPRSFPQDNGFGYQHPGPEVFYNATKLRMYSICQSGEDSKCSDQYSLPECLLHTCCHCSYLGMNPCDGAKPDCIQPSSVLNLPVFPRDPTFVV